MAASSGDLRAGQVSRQRREVVLTLIIVHTGHGGAIALEEGCAVSSSGTSRIGHVHDRRTDGAPTSTLQPQATAMPSLMQKTAWHSLAAACVYVGQVPDQRRTSH